MPRRIARRCIGCGTPTTHGPRCPRCKTQARSIYADGWQDHSRRRIAAYVANAGQTCPGWGVPPHPSTDLTLDHDDIIMCRSCNLRKRHEGNR